MKIVLDPKKTHAIIIDIDGTIADITKRLERARDEAGASEDEVKDTYNFYRSPKRFTFFDELFNPEAIEQLDIPLEGCVEKLKKLSEIFSIFYVTSRPKERQNDPENVVHEATAKWLSANGFPDGVLVTRARMQKKDAYFIGTISFLINNNYQIAFALDDLYDGKNHYESFGIDVIQINDNKFVLPELCIVKDGSEFCIRW